MRNHIIRVSDELLNLSQRYWALINEQASRISCLQKFTEIIPSRSCIKYTHREDNIVTRSSAINK